MDELICLNCGRGIAYDWAPCPHCGWKTPESWEESAEEPQEDTPASRNAVLAKPRRWIQGTVIVLLAMALAGLIGWIVRRV